MQEWNNDIQEFQYEAYPFFIRCLSIRHNLNELKCRRIAWNHNKTLNDHFYYSR